MVRDSKTLVENLFRDEAVQQRIMMIAVAPTSYNRVTSRSFSRLSDWQKAVRRSYPLRDQRVELPRIKLPSSPRTQKMAMMSIMNNSSQNHRAMGKAPSSTSTLGTRRDGGVAGTCSCATRSRPIWPLCSRTRSQRARFFNAGGSALANEMPMRRSQSPSYGTSRTSTLTITVFRFLGAPGAEHQQAKAAGRDRLPLSDDGAAQQRQPEYVPDRI